MKVVTSLKAALGAAGKAVAGEAGRTESGEAPCGEGLRTWSL